MKTVTREAARRAGLVVLVICAVALALMMVACGEAEETGEEIKVEKKSVLDGLRFEDALFSYDGEPHLPVLEGAPIGARVIYTDEDGNDTMGKINAGEVSYTGIREVRQ